jgi:hypothetical protein
MKPKASRECTGNTKKGQGRSQSFLSFKEVLRERALKRSMLFDPHGSCLTRNNCPPIFEVCVSEDSGHIGKFPLRRPQHGDQQEQGSE